MSDPANPSIGQQNLDVTRRAVIDMLNGARRHLKDNRGGYAEVWWDGYIRALEHVLEMEWE